MFIICSHEGTAELHFLPIQATLLVRPYTVRFARRLQPDEPNISHVKIL